MWKQKIGISLDNNYSLPTTEVVRIIAAAGFDAISPVWAENEPLDNIISAARSSGMIIQSLHAPFGKSNLMWDGDSEKSRQAKSELLSALEDCHRFDIPLLVMHTWIGFDYSFGETKYGFENYGEIIDKAEKYGIKIAFENTEGEEYLFALEEHFSDCENVGFCWDSGHEMCYNHSDDLLAKLGDRLLITHLNDNLGISRYDGKTFWTDDLHLLPYDGIADWDYNIDRLKKAKELDILNFELSIESKPNRH
ncbi:MAG: sugar phosphate isomerase/epimerase [Clostridia bacterium]|nr:sugar phosphate isomerase/epimerase [Clostridia bacterium]